MKSKKEKYDKLMSDYEKRKLIEITMFEGFIEQIKDIKSVKQKYFKLYQLGKSDQRKDLIKEFKGMIDEVIKEMNKQNDNLQCNWEQGIFVCRVLKDKLKDLSNGKRVQFNK